MEQVFQQLFINSLTRALIYKLADVSDKDDPSIEWCWDHDPELVAVHFDSRHDEGFRDYVIVSVDDIVNMLIKNI